MRVSRTELHVHATLCYLNTSRTAGVISRERLPRKKREVNREERVSDGLMMDRRSELFQACYSAAVESYEALSEAASRPCRRFSTCLPSERGFLPRIPRKIAENESQTR